MVNSRFTVAIHVLCLLAHLPAHLLPSEFIAGSVNTNPVVIRRILGLLRKGGLVRSQPGVAGGWKLKPEPSAITLGRVYQLVRPGTVFALHSKIPNRKCPVGRHIQEKLRKYYRNAEAALEQEFKRSTIADVLDDVLAAAK